MVMSLSSSGFCNGEQRQNTPLCSVHRIDCKKYDKSFPCHSRDKIDFSQLLQPLALYKQ